MLRQIDPPPAEDVSRHCGNCGYDLRAATTTRCPECGVAFDLTGPPVASIPWFHRRVIGNQTALWRTMWLVMLQPRELADEVRHDTRLDRPAARAFRRICVIVAGISIAVASAIGASSAMTAVAALAITLLPLLLFFQLTAPLMGLTDFDSPTRAARLETLHEFTNAPLLLMPLVPLTILFCRVTGQAMTPASLLVLFIATIWTLYKFAYQARASGRGAAWLVTHLAFAVIVWSCFALLCLGLILCAVAFTHRLIDW